MKSGLTLLIGRADTGKSERILRDLERRQRAGERAVLIVPEQYTFETERALVERLDGLFGVQVLSFERLAERVIALQGAGKTFLNAQGMRMVTRRAIWKRQGELRAFSRAADKTGFAEEMLSLFGDCKRAGISSETLKNASEEDRFSGSLSDKLHDVAILYEETEAYLGEKRMDADDAFDYACALLDGSFLCGAHVYIDGPERPNAQLFRMIEALLSVSASMTIALCADDGTAADGELFSPVRETLAQLTAMAAKRGVQTKIEQLTRQSDKCDAALRHLERNLYAYPAKRFAGDARAITLFGASDMRAEAESLAEAILERARSGVRYRDMAVIVSNMDAYASLIARACARRGIPVFLDQKRPLTGHAAANAILSAMRFVSGGSAPGDLLSLAKSGYACLEESDAEELELFLLRTGVRGAALYQPFRRKQTPEGAERARAMLTEPLKTLAERMKQKTVSDKVRAVYDYMLTLRLNESLLQRVQTLRMQNRAAEAEEHAQVWNTLVALLEQLDAVMGEVSMGREAFCRVFYEGLDGSTIGVIPGTSDQVLLGDVMRTKSRAVRALFIVGANDGMLPAPRTDDGVLDDRELDALKRIGLPLRQNSAALAAYDRLDLYNALSKARETLYISFAYSAHGSEASPAAMVKRIRAMFPSCAAKTDILRSDALPDCVSGGMTLLSAELRRYHGGEAPSARLCALYAYFSKREPFAAQVKRMERAGVSFSAGGSLRPKTARLLYGETLPMNASRLEQFNGCPFRHFLSYGLKAEETREFTERAVDIGSFYHAALDAFVRGVRERGLCWGTMGRSDALSVLDEVLPKVIAAHNDGIFAENERLRGTLFLQIEVICQSALAVLSQAQAGSFSPVQSERRFGEGQQLPALPICASDGTRALIGGVIDRVDEAFSGGERLSRVIDYKTSGRNFDFASVLHGLTLQLPLYRLAAAERGKKSAGVYYMPIRGAALEMQSDAAEDGIDAYRLRGLTLNEETALNATESNMSGASSVLYDVKKTGEASYAGSLCARNELDLLSKAAMEVAAGTLERMLKGEAAASPAMVGGGASACAYCAYRSVCRFDGAEAGCRTRRYEKIKASEFFALIGGNADGMDE